MLQQPIKIHTYYRDAFGSSVIHFNEFSVTFLAHFFFMKHNKRIFKENA